MACRCSVHCTCKYSYISSSFSSNAMINRPANLVLRMVSIKTFTKFFSDIQRFIAHFKRTKTKLWIYDQMKRRYKSNRCLAIKGHRIQWILHQFGLHLKLQSSVTLRCRYFFVQTDRKTFYNHDCFIMFNVMISRLRKWTDLFQQKLFLAAM